MLVSLTHDDHPKNAFLSQHQKYQLAVINLLMIETMDNHDFQYTDYYLETRASNWNFGSKYVTVADITEDARISPSKW